MSQQFVLKEEFDIKKTIVEHADTSWTCALVQTGHELEADEGHVLTWDEAYAASEEARRKLEGDVAELIQRLQELRDFAVRKGFWEHPEVYAAEKVLVRVKKGKTIG